MRERDPFGESYAPVESSPQMTQMRVCHVFDYGVKRGRQEFSGGMEEEGGGGGLLATVITSVTWCLASSASPPILRQA